MTFTPTGPTIKWQRDDQSWFVGRVLEYDERWLTTHGHHERFAIAKCDRVACVPWPGEPSVEFVPWGEAVIQQERND